MEVAVLVTVTPSVLASIPASGHAVVNGLLYFNAEIASLDCCG